jgi:hypothetical protein
MASPDPRYSAYAGPDSPNLNSRRSPLSINTSNVGALPQGRSGNRGNRFSYVETPVEMQEPQIPQQRYIPDATPIQESPASAVGVPALRSPQQQYNYTQLRSPQQQQHPAYAQPAQSSDAARQPENVHRTSSPYNVPEPQGTHPAYFAPVADPTTVQQPRSRPGSVVPPSSPPLPQQQYEQTPTRQAQRVSTLPLRSESDENTKKQSFNAPPQRIQIPYSPAGVNPPTRQPVFSPTSLAGPNGAAPDLHQPGQVVHPNMNMSSTVGSKSEWAHSLCECNADVGTCCLGVFCPCILDSRTAYRLERRAAHKDPTDMLGFSNCNGRCGAMSVLGVCGLFCEFLLFHILLPILSYVLWSFANSSN